jgi:hypothetical protein
VQDSPEDSQDHGRLTMHGDAIADFAQHRRAAAKGETRGRDQTQGATRPRSASVSARIAIKIVQVREHPGVTADVDTRDQGRQ